MSAHAGHWVFTATGSGSASLNGQVQFNSIWVAPTGTFTGGLSIPPISASQGLSPGGPPVTVSASANVTVTLKGTWTTDNNSDNTPPPGVLFAETSTAQANFSNGATGGPNIVQPGQANDGFGDPPIAFGTGIGTSSTIGAKYVKSSGSTITTTLTLSASASASQAANMGGGGAGAGVGPATISIHAQPFGWYCAGWDDPNGTHHDGPNITNGVLTFVWGWRSTSGNLGDLAGINIYETLDYSGNPGTFSADNTLFYPQSPPIQQGYNVPNGRAGSSIDPTKLYARDAHSPFAVMSIVPITFTIPQKYKFDDPATKEVGTLLYDCGNIVEGIYPNPNRWDITELGYPTAHTYY